MSDRPIIDIERKIKELLGNYTRYEQPYSAVRLDVKEPPVVSEKDVEYYKKRQRYHHQIAKW